VAKLIEKHGRKGNLMMWREMLNGDYPKRDGRMNDRVRFGLPGPSDGPLDPARLGVLQLTPLASQPYCRAV